VVAVKDRESFEEEVAASSFSTVLVDFLLDEGTGVDVVRGTASRLECPVVFVTQYYDRDASEAEHSVDPILVPQTISKPPAGAESDEIADWVESKLKPAVAYGSSTFKRVTSLDAAYDVGTEAIDLLATSASDVAKLALDEQLDMREAAVNAMQGWLAPRFSEDGVDWLVVIGEGREVVQWGSHSDAIPNVEELEKYQNDYDRVPLLIFRPIHVGLTPNPMTDGYWSNCGKANKIPAGVSDRFPEIHLEFRGVSAALHFDTGSEASFLSCERWVKGGFITEPRSPFAWIQQPIHVGLGDPEVISFFFFDDNGVLTPSRQGNMVVTLKALVVRDWRESKLALICAGGGCEGSALIRGGASPYYWCGSRDGLIGRDFLLTNKLQIVLDGRNHRTFALDAGDLAEVVDGDQEDGHRQREWGFRGRR
jgi:hypothetical protein